MPGRLANENGALLDLRSAPRSFEVKAPVSLRRAGVPG